MSELPEFASDSTGRFPVIRFNIHAEEPLIAIAQFRDYTWGWSAPSRSFHDVGNFDRDFFRRRASFTDVELALSPLLVTCVGLAFALIHGDKLWDVVKRLSLTASRFVLFVVFRSVRMLSASIHSKSGEALFDFVLAPDAHLVS